MVDQSRHRHGADKLAAGETAADRLPETIPIGLAMQIAPRTLLCGTTFREGLNVADAGFDELRELCRVAGDQRSMAIGMAGLMTAQEMDASWRDSSRLATELVGLLQSHW